MQQEIHFCQTPDGVRLAWSKSGSGPPLVKTAHWLGHLEYDVDSPVWRPYIAELAKHYTLIRYDQRGCGLSDRDVDRHDLETWEGDLAAVVDAAGLDTFHLLAESQGGPIGIRYAARHPERIRKIAFFGAYARGAHRRGLAADAKAELSALHALIEVGWGSDVSAYRQLFGNLFMPRASEATVDAFAELMRVATKPAMAARIARALSDLDAVDLAPGVRAPALVLHAREDARVPAHEGRLLASLLPDARFVPLDTANHILQPDEPAFTQFFREFHAFFGVESERADLPGTDPDWLADLTQREAEVLAHLAAGKSNKQIARSLHLSPKTIRNYVSIILSKSPATQRTELIVLAREADVRGPE